MSDQNLEIELIAHSNEDCTEFVVVLRRPGKPMSCEEICVELESYVHDINKAEFQKNQPGVRIN